MPLKRKKNKYVLHLTHLNCYRWMKATLYQYYKLALKALPDFRQTLNDLCDYCKDNSDSIALRVLTIISELISSISMLLWILIIYLD